MFGVSNILNSNGQVDCDDYYKLLNSDENSSSEQINAEFKVLALEWHPDKNPDNKEALLKFQSLQEARDILTDQERRLQYDKWRRSEVAMSFKQWIGLKGRCEPTMHWAKPKTQTMIEGVENRIGDVESQGNKDHENSEMDSWAENSIKVTKKSKWQSEPSRGVYQKFRNYQI